MARETRVEQVHPEHENEKIKALETFGWEVISNQRCQEQKGDYIYTFNKITFSRDKSAPWYNRVRELEKEYGDILSCDYQEIKDKYGYEKMSGLGNKPVMPIKPNYPNVAEPKVFYKSLRTLIIFIALSLVFMFLSKNDAFTVQVRDFLQFLTRACLIASGVGLIITLIRIQYLVGLKGDEAKKAIEEYKEADKLYKEELIIEKEYYDSVKLFIKNREKAILKELESIIK